jgi:hypothetical protein
LSAAISCLIFSCMAIFPHHNYFVAALSFSIFTDFHQNP